MNDKKEFCCEGIFSHLFMSSKKTPEIHFNYYPVFREYFIDYKEIYGGGIQLIRYCPWCGSKLPKELRNEWFDTLKKEYNIETDIMENRPDIPPEFKTDEW